MTKLQFGIMGEQFLGSLIAGVGILLVGVLVAATLTLAVEQGIKLKELAEPALVDATRAAHVALVKTSCTLIDHFDSESHARVSGQTVVFGSCQSVDAYQCSWSAGFQYVPAVDHGTGTQLSVSGVTSGRAASPARNPLCAGGQIS
jgi:hypothetical protein